MQWPHNRGHTLDLVSTHRLNIEISSIVYVALSDHYCVFFTALTPTMQYVRVLLKVLSDL